MATQRSTDFLFTHTSWSYDPKTETETQGRERIARTLAKAEREAYKAGYSFTWEVDDIDSSDFSDESPPWALWYCVCHDESGEVVACLRAIDFGRDNGPWGDPYRRVVEAELAHEALS